MKSRSLRLLGIALTLVTAACASSSTTDKTLGQLSFNDFETVAGTLTVTANSISGTGALIFPEPVTGDEFNFKLTFTLEDGGSLTWISFAEAALANGVETKFTRASAALQTRLLFNNASATTPATLTDIDASSEISLFVEAHNGESPTHLMVFPGDLAGAFLSTDALFNSEDSGPTPGQGAGKFFGVRLENATLTAVVGAEAKYSDE